LKETIFTCIKQHGIPLSQIDQGLNQMSMNKKEIDFYQDAINVLCSQVEKNSIHTDNIGFLFDILRNTYLPIKNTKMAVFLCPSQKMVKLL